MIHTVKGFSVINEAKVDVFLEFSCFFYDPTDVGNLISGSSGFSKSSLTSGISWFTCYWSLAWRILSIILLTCEMSEIVQWIEHSLALPFFGIGMKSDLFQSCGHCWVFQIFWHVENRKGILIITTTNKEIIIVQTDRVANWCYSGNHIAICNLILQYVISYYNI